MPHEEAKVAAQTPYEELKVDAVALGDRLRWAREMVSGGPTRLAADVGVDTSAIRHIERGARLPSLHLLQALCHVLRISPQYLLDGSLAGVDPELAAKLKAAHPELSWPASPGPGSDRNSSPSSGHRPKTHGRPESVSAR
jgi:transcriptional regulator with XRE-family HTH domain